MTTIAYPNKDKKMYLARVKAHRLADEIVQGTGFGDGKGCAIGCTLDEYNHAKYAELIGVDWRVARAIDAIHEGLPLKDAIKWPERVLRALPEGADTSRVWNLFAVKLLRRVKTRFKGDKKDINAVIVLLKKPVGTVSPGTWADAALNAAMYVEAADYTRGESMGWAARALARTVSAARGMAGAAQAPRAAAAGAAQAPRAAAAGAAAGAMAEAVGAAAQAMAAAAGCARAVWTAAELAAEVAERKAQADDLISVLAACKPPRKGRKHESK